MAIAGVRRLPARVRGLLAHTITYLGSIFEQLTRATVLLVFTNKYNDIFKRDTLS